MILMGKVDAVTLGFLLDECAPVNPGKSTFHHHSEVKKYAGKQSNGQVGTSFLLLNIKANSFFLNVWITKGVVTPLLNFFKTSPPCSHEK